MGFFTSRAVGIVVAVVGLVGLTGLTYPVWSDSGEDPVLPVVVGLTMLGAAAAAWQVRVAGRDVSRAVSSARSGDEPAVELRLRNVTPVVMTVVGATFGLGSAAAVLAVGLTEGGLLFSPLVLLFGLLLVEGVRAWGRLARITLGVDTIIFRGWSLESRLAWDDVQRVRLVVQGKYSRVQVEGRPGAPSWEVTSHRLVLPLERRPAGPQIAVWSSALDDPVGLRIALDRLVRADRATRRELVADPGLLTSDG